MPQQSAWNPARGSVTAACRLDHRHCDGGRPHPAALRRPRFPPNRGHPKRARPVLPGNVSLHPGGGSLQSVRPSYPRHSQRGMPWDHGVCRLRGGGPCSPAGIEKATEIVGEGVGRNFGVALRAPSQPGEHHVLQCAMAAADVVHQGLRAVH